MTQFETKTNDLLLRIPTYQTDDFTHSFLKKYCPLLADRPQGNWTSRPPLGNAPVDSYLRHSLTFTKHPFVDIRMTEARLDVLTKEQNEKPVGYLTYFVNFFFENRSAADGYFEQLCSQYEPLSQTIIKKTLSDRKVAIYKENDTTLLLNQVQIILLPDDFYETKYKIIFGVLLDEKFDEHYGS